MKRVLLLVVAFALLVTPFAMVSAQDPEGGVIIEGNGGTSVGAMNPLRCSGTDCSRINLFLFPGLINVDPATANFAPGAPGGLATDWTLSEDGLTYTFTLRDDFFWTDGERVDAWDWAFAFEAANSDLIESALIGYTQEIASYEVLDDGLTLTVTFNEAACTNLSNIAFVTPIPHHHFGWTPENAAEFDYAQLVVHDFDTNPEPSAGVFRWESMQAGERIALVPNEEYVDAPEGVQPGGFLYINVPDQVVMAERFIAGELNVMEGPQNAVRQQIRDTEGLQYFDFAGNSWDYVGLNYANPDNPQSAEVGDDGQWTGNYVDAEGNVTDSQDAHPIFGDVRVRRALQLGINIDEIMEKAVLGEGTVMAANILPTSWAVHPDLQPVAYDPEAAAALLAEAGWADSDGDGILDKDGVALEFELLTNEGNARRGQIGELLQDQWGALGVQVNFSAIDFNALLEIMDAQTFDAFILGWRQGFPDDPDQTTLFTTANDIVASGQNNVSYSNPEVDQLMLEAKTVEGCSPADRAPIYHQIQEIIQADQPYLWLFAQNGMYAASDNIQGFAPYPSQLYWNVDNWTVTN
jgi:peptide/nickel transport system substrate-binding protein